MAWALYQQAEYEEGIIFSVRVDGRVAEQGVGDDLVPVRRRRLQHVQSLDDQHIRPAHEDLTVLHDVVLQVRIHGRRDLAGVSRDEALAHLRRLTSPDGALILAIENQLGLRYLLGDHEDHLLEPWAGVEGPNSRGVT